MSSGFIDAPVSLAVLLDISGMTCAGGETCAYQFDVAGDALVWSR
jgi:hypothetical protein